MPEAGDNKLQVVAASLSETGRKSPAINEDFAATLIPNEEHLLRCKGVVAAVADGVSSAGAGREASQEVVERFIAEYFQTPDTWSVSHCGENILSTVNLRLYRRSHDYGAEGKGFLSTFSTVVIKGHTAHFFHIGDSRIYRLPADSNELECITRDHSRSVGEGQSFLTRAIGMDNHLPLDYGRVDINAGDRLFLSSDGVHDFIEADNLAAILNVRQAPEECCRILLDTALDNGSDDNLSAVVVDIQSLADAQSGHQNDNIKRLPFPPDDLAADMVLDGYKIVKELFASSRSHLYLVEDTVDGLRYAMKVPSRNFEEDVHYIDRFVQEEWIGLRITSPNVVKVIRVKRERTALYYVMEFVSGCSLDRWMQDHPVPSPKKAIAIIEQVATGLQAFHDNEAIHQDLKPANIMVCEDGRVVLVDFGSVYVAGLAELRRMDAFDEALGTASYADPMYLQGENPGIAGDVYSLATISYEMFTGSLPYGAAVEEFTSAAQYHRKKYLCASDLNPVVPLWFDRALEKGVKFDLQERYSTVAAFYQDLRNPNPEFLRDDPPSQGGSNSLLFWKLLSGFWFGVIILLVYLFSQAA